MYEKPPRFVVKGLPTGIHINEKGNQQVIGEPMQVVLKVLSRGVAKRVWGIKHL